MSGLPVRLNGLRDERNVPTHQPLKAHIGLLGPEFVARTSDFEGNSAPVSECCQGALRLDPPRTGSDQVRVDPGRRHPRKSEKDLPRPGHAPH